jgi:hypothetical protein
MLDSLPVPFQAILWPLVGAALILALHRLLPNWARQLLGLVAALASFLVLWSLQVEAAERVEILWAPLNFFRMSPVLYADGLSRAGGIVLAGVTAAMLLGIRGSRAQSVAWRGAMLVVLAGCLSMTMAGNLLALALASAIVDLALMTAVVLASDADPTKRLPLRVAVPGIASTLLVFVSALEFDAQVGHASLLSRNLPVDALVLVGVAGVLRALVYPLHPRGVRVPEYAVILLLPVGTGFYLVSRVQALLPVLSDRTWLVVLMGLALLAGGLLASSGGSSSTARHSSSARFGRFWAGALVHQTGYGLAFALLLAGVAPWPLASAILSLGALAIWWYGGPERTEPSPSRAPEWLSRRTGPWLEKARSYVAMRLPVFGRWRDSWFGRYGAAFLPTIALMALVGVPFTAGARGRWSLYAAWLQRGDLYWLLALLADTFLVYGLWVAAGLTIEQAGTSRLRPAALLAIVALIVPLVVLGIAPGVLGDGLGLQPSPPSDVSVWGLGLVYLLPWLLGSGLARMRNPLKGYLERAWDVVNLNWLYRAGDWAGDRLVGAVYWLGKVGEGDGWWGWALVILSLGVLLLATR